jgi:hypothetical protein
MLIRSTVSSVYFFLVLVSLGWLFRLASVRFVSLGRASSFFFFSFRFRLFGSSGSFGVRARVLRFGSCLRFGLLSFSRGSLSECARVQWLVLALRLPCPPLRLVSRIPLFLSRVTSSLSLATGRCPCAPPTPPPLRVSRLSLASV